MDQIQYKLKSESNGNLETINSGILENIDSNFYESKHFWDGAIAYKNPVIVFFINDKTESLTLNKTEKGYSGTKFSHGVKYGCNLNRVRNRKNRWGLTVWLESKLSNENKEAI